MGNWTTPPLKGGVKLYDKYMEINPTMKTPTYTAEQVGNRDYYLVRKGSQLHGGVMFSTLMDTYVNLGYRVFVRTNDGEVTCYN